VITQETTTLVVCVGGVQSYWKHLHLLAQLLFPGIKRHVGDSSGERNVVENTVSVTLYLSCILSPLRTSSDVKSA